MSEKLNVDICVIGAGSGGLSVAAGASQLGMKTVLIEKHKMGGDCLNYGCVPSKALLAAAHAAEAQRRPGPFGIESSGFTIRQKDVYKHVRDVIAAIEPNDSVERFSGLGVRVILSEGRFVAPDRVAARDFEITARRFVVATGSSAFVPPIPGIEQTPHLTNETIFDRDAVPERLIVVGGGPIGIEMAQAHRRLGADVTVLDMATIMPKDDPELVDVVRRRLVAEGVDIRENIRIARVEKSGAGVAVVLKSENGETRIEGSDLLIAAGRRPNVKNLGLEAAGVEYSDKGIKVDRSLRTTNKRVYAVGDVAGGLQFTHVAGFHAGIVIKNALFRLPANADAHPVPWVTYTDPELAQVGLTEAEARKQGVEFRVLRWPFHENDRAQAERRTEGLAKIVTTPRGKILGAGIAGPHAGELILTWVLAMDRGIKAGAVAQVVAPYPTLSEVSKRAAGSLFTASLFSERTKKIVRFLARFG